MFGPDLQSRRPQLLLATSLSKVSDRFHGSECAFLTRKSSGLNQGHGSAAIAAGGDEPIHDFSQVAQAHQNDQSVDTAPEFRPFHAALALTSFVPGNDCDAGCIAPMS